MREFKPVEYLSSLFKEDEVRVSLSDGRVVVLRRAGLGRHYHLRSLTRKIGASELDLRVDLLRGWLEAAGIKEPDTLSLSDLLTVVRLVGRLNAPRGQMVWSLLPEREVEEKPVDYPGRALARIVDLLARHYGWSLEEIINLPPEVALAHMQECILYDRRQREWEHYRSEIFWEYDAASKMRHYRPPEPLSWEKLPIRGRRSYKPVPPEIIERYYPKGVVIDLTQRAGAKRNSRED